MVARSRSGRARPAVFVVDDVLPPRAFRALCAYAEHQPVSSVHAEGRDPSWAADDGDPQRGPCAFAEVTGGPSGLAFVRGSTLADALHQHPTGTAIDRVFRVIAQHARAMSARVGLPGAAYRAVTARVYRYAHGTSLDWHVDSVEHYSGAFVLYAHEVWDRRWGGELLVVGRDRHAAGEHDGTFLEPRPNRLVVIGGGAPHRVTRVTAAAGDHVRTSIGGFFVRPEVLDPSPAREGAGRRKRA